MAQDANLTPNPRHDDRREIRFALSVEIEVDGIDRAGHPFRAVTKTSEVSDWGCSFFLPFDLDANSVVSLSVVGTQPHCLPQAHPVIFQIMNCRRTGDRWLLGASKAQPERLWNLDGVDVPPES